MNDARAGDCSHELCVAGIGASAGGLEALEEFFDAAPTDLGIAFVVVQHLSPDFKSHMEELLSRRTQMEIHRVTNGMPVEPNRVYLIPPKMEMVISDGRLLLTEKSPERQFSHPIDQFFRSLAADMGRRAVGIVLSGTGSDGSRGVREIHEAGGLVLVQDETTAKFDGMPLNAQATGEVDVVASPAALAKALSVYAREGLSREALAEAESGYITEKGLEKIFQLLRVEHGLDFSSYKANTVGRRIDRRMQLGGFTSLDSYADTIEHDRDLLNALYHDLLIGVTRFFRDKEAFDRLQEDVVPSLVEKCRQGEALRVWVAGCATGEEAYSIAMVFQDVIQAIRPSLELRIFATDVHQSSLASAARGIYPADAMRDVSSRRVDTYFRPQRDGYQVSPELRRRVLFAPHNVISDAPFTQMDMVVCRNMLIYLQPQAQKKALSLFHFALKTSGVLFLGPSESPGDLVDEFQVVESRWRIYRKRRDIRLPVDARVPLRETLAKMPRMNWNPGTRAPSSRVDRGLMGIYDRLLDRFMPPSILVTESFELEHTFGGAEQYLTVRGGRASKHLMEMVSDGLRTALASLQRQTLRTNGSVRFASVEIQRGDTMESVDIQIDPFHDPATKVKYFLIRIEPQAERATQPLPAPSVEVVQSTSLSQDQITALEGELRFTKENLQATIEELETSNEELQSTNEELHSVNEELYTVNAEHQRRVLELAEAHDDMDNLLATTRVGVIFVDSELYIRRFTPEIGRIFHLVPKDIGRSIRGFSHNLQYASFLEDLERVLASGRESEIEAQDKQGRVYLVRISPYRRSSELDGVVVSLIDITVNHELKAETQRLLSVVAQSEFRLRRIIDNLLGFVGLLEPDGRIVEMNAAATHATGISRDEVLGHQFTDLPWWEHNPDDRERAVEAIKRAAEGETQRFDMTLRLSGGISMVVDFMLSPIRDESGEVVNLVPSAIDITSRKTVESELRLRHTAINSALNGILITDHTHQDEPIVYVNRGFTEMTGYSSEQVIGKNCRLLQGPDTDQSSIQVIRDAIRDGKACRVVLKNYKQDGTHFWNDLQIAPVHDAQNHLVNFVGIQHDITAQVEAKSRADEFASQIRAVLDSTPQGIYGLDAEGNCIFCNAACNEMLGYEADDLMGKNMHALIHSRRADGTPLKEADCPIRLAYLRGERIHVEDDVFWKSNGTHFPVEYWSHPILRNGQVLGAVVTFFDTSRRREQEQELRDARLAADAANRAKSQFLANMSHELRTPMAAVMGFCEILLQETSDAHVRDRVSIIQRNGEYLLKLLNDILDLSRVEAGAVHLERERVGLNTWLHDLIGMMQLRASEVNRPLRFHFPTELPESIETDPSRLRQILVNLIGNAIKFSPDGAVDVTVRTSREKGSIQLQFVVSDTGIGMSAEHLRRLFQPFSQAEDRIAKEFGGTGLGLSISRRLADSMGATLHVVSRLGAGSEFILSLPVTPEEMETAFHFEAETPSTHPVSITTPEPRTESQADWKMPEIHARILLADDMRDVRYIAKHFLESAGCDVTVAENGLLAIEAIESAIVMGRPYDLAIIDVQMPVMDGLETVRALRARAIQLPTIALTADAMKGTRERVLNAGFDEYLSKPINAMRLLSTVARVLHLTSEEEPRP